LNQFSPDCATEGEKFKRGDGASSQPKFHLNGSG
jgi:hypothetical protein